MTLSESAKTIELLEKLEKSPHIHAGFSRFSNVTPPPDWQVTLLIREGDLRVEATGKGPTLADALEVAWKRLGSVQTQPRASNEPEATGAVEIANSTGG